MRARVPHGASDLRIEELTVRVRPGGIRRSGLHCRRHGRA
jgi:hypothetical protein